MESLLKSLMNMRKPVPDMMKGVAVLCMIQVHIMELFAKQTVYQGIAGKVSLFLGGPFAAPVFMAIMGYFVAASLKRRGEKGKRGRATMLKRGLVLILLGLLLNIGLNLHLLIKIFNGTFDLDPLDYIFGADILFLAGFSIIFIALLESLFRQQPVFYLFLAAVFAFLPPYLPDLPESFRYLEAFLWGHLSWSYFPLFPWMSYPLVGYAFFHLEKKFPAFPGKRNWIYLSILFLSFVLLVWQARFAFRISSDLPSYYHHDILLFLYIVLFLIIWTSIVHEINKFYGETVLLQYLRWLGKNVTAVYVIQWLIIGNIATAIYKTQPLWVLFLWMIFITTMTSLAVYFWNRIKVSIVSKTIIK